MPVYEDERNPMRIPDLTPMYEAVRDFVKENQGDKGFICTDDEKCDTIWTIVYSDMYATSFEYEVKAVRVKNEDLEIIYDYPGIIYEDEEIRNRDEDDWSSVQYDDFVYYIPTIFNLAENIQEYV